VKCQVCKVWSHSDCVGNPKEFKCVSCWTVAHAVGVQLAREEESVTLYVSSEEVAKKKQSEVVGVFRCVCGDPSK
jgi:hypothetical protein